MRHGVAMRLDLFQKPAGFHQLDDLLARREAVEPVELIPDGLALRRHLETGEEVLIVPELDGGFDGQDVDRRQLVALADLEVVEVMRGRDLDRA